MKHASLYTSDHVALVELLKDLRLEAGLSQTDVAKALKRPQTYLSAIEVGQRGLDLLQVRELAALYGLTFPAFATAFEKRRQHRPYKPPRLPRRDAKPRTASKKAATKKAGKRRDGAGTGGGKTTVPIKSKTKAGSRVTRVLRG